MSVGSGRDKKRQGRVGWTRGEGGATRITK